ncbi:MAG: DUF4923 family protein [Alistipes sp.]
MKKILLISLLICGLGHIEVKAQSLESLLKKAVEGAVKQIEEQSTATNAATETSTAVEQHFPSAQELAGVWSYAAPTTEYKGDDPLAALALGGLHGHLNGFCDKIGLVPGRDKITFNTRGTIHVALAGHTADGTYQYNPATGALHITVPVEKTHATFKGKVAHTSEALTLLFEADEALRVMETTSSKLAQNSNVKNIGELISQFPGIFVGCKLTR